MIAAVTGRARVGRSVGTRALWIAAVWLVAFALTMGLAPYLQREVFGILWIAVLFAAWHGGLPAALVAAVASVVAVDYVIIPPTFTPRGPSLSDLAAFVAFVAASAIVSAAAAARARAQRDAEVATEQLQDQATELEQQAGELEQTNEELATALAEAETTADRARRLLAVATGLNEATTPEQVADVIFREAMAAVGADAGSLVLLVDEPSGDRTFETVRTMGFGAALTARYQRYPLRAGRPLSDAVLAHEPRLLESADEWRRQYPAVLAETGALGFEAFAAVPASSGGRALGGLTFSFAAPVRFDGAMRTFLQTLGEQCGLALERARAFEAERRAREWSTATLASIRDGFVAFDREFRYTYLNPTAESMLDRPAAELLGRVTWEAFPGVEDSPIGRAFRRVMETRVTETVEARSVTLGMWLEVRMFPAPDGITAVFHDVTDRRRAQDAAAFVAEASRLLNASLDDAATLRAVAHAAVPVLGDWCAVDLVRDPDAPTWPPQLDRVAVVHEDPAKIALAEEMAARYPTDWSAPGAVAAALRDRTPTFVPTVIDAMLVAAARDEGHLALLRALRFSSIIVVPLVARDRTLGALTLCMTESGRHYDEADVVLAQDVAQRAAIAVDNARLYAAAGAARHEAETARRRAEEANALKAQFLATMSHELRTPLNAIAGHVQLVELGLHGPVTDAQRDALERVTRAQRHLLGLINDILNYARLEGGRVEYRLEPVALRDTVADVLALIEPQLAAKGIAFTSPLLGTVDAAGAAVRVWADREKLAQVLLNLLSNAVKFTPSGGRVSVEVATRLDASDPPGVAFVRVSDTGIGIPDDKLEAVFEPFVQVGKAYTRETGGTGLGLTISRDLAQGMGGDLRARSRQARGSTFTLTLRRVADGE